MNDDPPNATVADYKRLLQQVCDNRPSGTRGRLALALGTNRSFVSQLVNPVYPMPVPAQHLETVFEVCHFSPTEREAFLTAYDQAHPGRREIGEASEQTGRSTSRCLIWDPAAKQGGRRHNGRIRPPVGAPGRR